MGKRKREELVEVYVPLEVAEKFKMLAQEMIQSGEARDEPEVFSVLLRKHRERVAIAKKAGHKGGTARAERHTTEQISEMARTARMKMPKAERKAIARKAAEARWAKVRESQQGGGKSE